MGPDDPRLKTTADLFAFYAGRIEMCLQAFGVSAEYAHILHYSYVVESGHYRRKYIWEQAFRAHSLYSPLKKLMPQNLRKKIIMTDEKLEVINKYSSKIHKAAAKFYRMLEKDYHYVGIRRFDEL